jgi:hypothetical protein
VAGACRMRTEQGPYLGHHAFWADFHRGRLPGSVTLWGLRPRRLSIFARGTLMGAYAAVLWCCLLSCIQRRGALAR